MKGKRSNQGVTLVELIIVVFILSVGISGILLLFVNSMSSTYLAWDMTVAVSHAEHILEEMQLKKSTADIVNNNWKDWAKKEGLYTLPRQRIAVKFADELSNPLDITVDVSWRRKQRRTKVSLTTKLIK